MVKFLGMAMVYCPGLTCIYTQQKKVLHRWVFGLILSWPEIVAFNVIYRCLQKSFCNNLMHSKLKSKVPLLNCEASRGHPSKVIK